MFPSEDLFHALTRAAKRVDLDPDAPEWLIVAKRQALELEQSRLINVALGKERDEALALREHALDLAAQYARLAGIEHPDLDDALRYAEQWRERLDSWGRLAGEQEARRIGNLDLATQLGALAAGNRAFTGTPLELAKAVAGVLVSLNSAQHGPGKLRDLFVAPDVPGVAACLPT